MLPELSSPMSPLREIKSPLGQVKDYEDEWCDIFCFYDFELQIVYTQ